MIKCSWQGMLCIIAMALAGACSDSNFGSGAKQTARSKPTGAEPTADARQTEPSDVTPEGPEAETANPSSLPEDPDQDGEHPKSEDPEAHANGGAGANQSGTSGSGGDTSSSTVNPLESLNSASIGADSGTIMVAICSKDYIVPGRANPYFAGTAAAATIAYTAGKKTVIDSAATESPVLVTPVNDACIKSGNRMYFKVSGTISHGEAAPTSADGRVGQVTSHQKGGILGKSNVVAPLNSLVGVFLDGADPSGRASPEPLNFSTAASREYQEIAPKIGQVFFIGDGKTQDGRYQRVIVPKGATRLYFGIMDGFEWKNNSGQLTGSIFVEK